MKGKEYVLLDNLETEGNSVLFKFNIEQKKKVIIVTLLSIFGTFPVLVIRKTRLSLRLIIKWVPSEGFHAPYHDD